MPETGWLMHIRSLLGGLVVIVGTSVLLAAGASGQAPVRISAVATRSIGLDEDSLFFDKISGVVALPDGELVVAEVRVPQVRLIDPVHLTASFVGGAGGGPGEFRFPRDLGALPGRFWVWDPGALRFTLLSDSMRVERTFRAPPLTGAAALLSGGVIAGRRVSADRKEASRWLVLFDAEHGVARDSIFLQNPEQRLRLHSGTLDMTSLQYWSDHTLWAPAPDGSGVVVVERPTSGDPEVVVRWYDQAARIRGTVRVPYEPVPITRRRVQRLADAISTAFLGASPRFRSSIDPDDFSPSAIARQLYVPDRLPPVTAVAVGEAGEVYLRRQSPENAHQVDYWILDRAGLRGVITLPADFHLLSVNRRELWGVRTDELEREYLVQYRLEHPPSR